MTWTAARAKRHPNVTDAQYVARFLENSVINRRRCFVWSGTVSSKGYGQVSYRNKQWLLHRLSHVIHLGQIPAGKLVCHTCDNRRCWNPDHLWLGTNKENMVDCSRKGRADDQWRTHCIHGHPFDEQNTYRIQMTETVKRACKRCQLIRARLRLGWPEDLAWSLPPTQRGYNRYGEPCKSPKAA